MMGEKREGPTKRAKRRINKAKTTVRWVRDTAAGRIDEAIAKRPALERAIVKQKLTSAMLGQINDGINSRQAKIEVASKAREKELGGISPKDPERAKKINSIRARYSDLIERHQNEIEALANAKRFTKPSEELVRAELARERGRRLAKRADQSR